MEDNNKKGLRVVHSFVHQNKERKITSLTLCIPNSLDDKALYATISEKIQGQSNPIRIKLGLNEVAAIATKDEWSGFHSFGDNPGTKINWKSPFFSVEKNGKKIAIRLTDDEIAGFQLALTTAFQHLLMRWYRGYPS